MLNPRFKDCKDNDGINRPEQFMNELGDAAKYVYVRMKGDLLMAVYLAENEGQVFWGIFDYKSKHRHVMFRPVGRIPDMYYPLVVRDDDIKTLSMPDMMIGEPALADKDSVIRTFNECFSRHSEFDAANLMAGE